MTDFVGMPHIYIYMCVYIYIYIHTHFGNSPGGTTVVLHYFTAALVGNVYMNAGTQVS